MTPEEKREYIREWRKNNPDKVKKYRENYNNSDHGKAYKKQWEKQNRERLNELSRQEKRRARQEAINILGGKCGCCNEETYEFLSIDHVYGKGGKERKELTSQQLFRRIRSGQVDITKYRVLCHNCNMAVAYYEICPHKINAEA